MKALPDGLDEMTILNELRRRGTPDLIEQAIAWCGDRRWTMRCLGADILALFGGEELPLAAESEAALMRLLDDSDEDVLAAAVGALGNLDLGDTQRIADVAPHASSTVRRAVAWCLGLREAAEGRDALVALSTDAIAEVRRNATAGLAALVEIDGESIQEALRARLEDPDAETRTQAMVGLALRGDIHATAAIEAAIEVTPAFEDLVAMAAAGFGDTPPVPPEPEPR